MNGYVCFFKGKRHEVQAETSYAAQVAAAAHFNAKKRYDVTVVLAEKQSVPVVHDGASLPGA
jgi:hypothetical protein